MKSIALMLITILPIAIYIYIEDSIHFTWNINNSENINKYMTIVEINPENKEMYINQKIEYVNNTNKELDKIFFYLFSQSIDDDICSVLKSELDYQVHQDKKSRILNIRSIKGKGKALNYNIIGKKRNILMVNLGSQIKEGQKVDIEINGVLNFPHIVDKTSDGRAVYDIINWYPVIAQYDNGWILDIDEEYNKIISYDKEYHLVEIILPEDTYAKGSGYLIDEERKGDKKHLTYEDSELTHFTFVSY